MSRSIVIAERAASRVLRLLAAVNLLFLAAFLVTLALATGKAYPQDDTCRGGDMLAELEAGDPDTLARIRAEAATVDNGSGLLWRIEKPGMAPSWLFGTMHMADPRVVALPQDAAEAFSRAGTLAIETTDILDQSTLLAAMLADPELTMFTDDTTLVSLLTPHERDIVERGLAERGIRLASVQKMKPWMLVSMVAVPACELERRTLGQAILDVRLAEDAADAGMELVGLESVADQLGAMASLPMRFHIDGLVATLAIGERIDDVMETMVRIYLDQETGLFWPFFRVALPGGDGGESGFAAFEETMVVARNRTMAERAVPLLDAGGAFVAVGALHLPGPNGLVAMLREAGYRVTRGL